jgi:AGZA family xanthine/uracil permease-like MFS transporter
MSATAPSSPAPEGGAIARYFKFAERGTTLGTEFKAGLTTFAVMAYIVFLNPIILSNAGIDVAAAAAATALVAGLLTILMGVVGNVPIALAAGLGINGIVAFGLVLGAGLSLPGAMGVIVLEGLVVLVLVLVGLREAIMNAIPMSLKRAIGAGIGLFILFIGLVDGGLIRQPAGDGPVPVEFVFPTEPAQFLTILGIFITFALFVRKVPASLLISIVVISVIGIVTGITPAPQLSPTISFATLGQFNVVEPFEKLGVTAALLTIFALMLTDFFDTMGTATAIGEQADLVDEKGRVEGIGRILLVDSVGAVAGGAAGISSNTSYIESAAGVAEGGRTGFASVVTGLLFLLMIFVAPAAMLVPYQATAPVLIVVGFLMFSLVKDIDVTSVEDGLPALLTMILMPLTFSITVGIGAGFVFWTFLKVVMGKFGEVHWLMWIVSIAFVIYFAQNLIAAYT